MMNLFDQIRFLIVILLVGLLSFLATRYSMTQFATQLQDGNGYISKTSSYTNSVEPPIFPLPSKDNNKSYSNEYSYVPSVLEDFVMKNLDTLGFNQSMAPICKMFKGGDAMYANISTEIQQYIQVLNEYTSISNSFQRMPDMNNTSQSLVRQMSTVYQKGQGELTWDDVTKQVCEPLQTLRVPFMKYNSTLFSYSSRAGYLDSLLPVLRHPTWCTGDHGILDLDYLVHDFYTMCRNLKPTSRIILVDMGASLDFHGGQQAPPAYLIANFRKFGFYLDHIYAFEVTQQDPNAVYKAVPNEWVPSYHWMNIPVKADESGTYLNPFQMILHEFQEEDLILVKLDIDTPALELTLVNQLLAHVKDGEDGKIGLGKLIDDFYFEHHVEAYEMQWSWNPMNGTVKESLLIFESLRKNGIASHHWV